MTVLPHGKRRGEPLVVLVAVIGLWAVARAVLWQSPFPLPLNLPSISNLADARFNPPAPPEARQTAGDGEAPSVQPKFTGTLPVYAIAPQIALGGLERDPSRAAVQVEVFFGHQVMWLAAMARIPVPVEIAQLMYRAEPVLSGSRSDAEPWSANEPTGRARWSLDGWSLYRPNSPGLPRAGQGSLPASYGSSQAGAVFAYRIAPANPHDPAVYLRGTQALAGSRESEIAFGLSARPFAKMPLRAQAEARLLRSGGQAELRPAAFVVSEFPQADLPLGLRADTYLQAGYVGGTFATPFVDGQTRVTREIADFDLAKLDAGLGAWGGAQQGAARLDLGPTAGLKLKVGEVPARLSVDYRHRIVGNAAPQSGMALTLSTSF